MARSGHRDAGIQVRTGVVAGRRPHNNPAMCSVPLDKGAADFSTFARAHRSRSRTRRLESAASPDESNRQPMRRHLTTGALAKTDRIEPTNAPSERAKERVKITESR